MRLSGLQKEVLVLYRHCLRESRKKPKQTRAHFESWTQNEFRRNATIDKRDFAAIELLLRKGKRQLEKGSSHRFPKLGLRHKKKGDQNQSKPAALPESPVQQQQQHLSTPVARLRRDQRNILRRRRGSKVRVSFSRSSASGSSTRRRRTAAKADKGKKPIGKRTAEVVETWVGDIAKQFLAPKDSDPNPHIDRSQIGRPQLQGDLHDGENSSKPTTHPAAQRNTRCSSAHVPEDHPYWGAIPVPPTEKLAKYSMPAGGGRRTQGQRIATLDAEVPVESTVHEPSLRRETAIARRPVGAPYRSGPVGRPTTTKPPARTSGRVRDFSTATTTTSKKEKRYGMADPLVWEAVSRSLSQQYRLSSLVTTEELPAPNLDVSETPSRSSSRKRALNRFTKDLEKYANVTGASGRLPVIPSTATATESRNTLHTVDELLPYHDEFRAAGLAVTSAEQKERSPNRMIRFGRDNAQLDGAGGGPDDFLGQDDLSHLFVDEIPPPKRKKVSPKKMSPWVHMKQHPFSTIRNSQLPQIGDDEVLPTKEATRVAPLEPSPCIPRPPRATQMKDSPVKYERYNPLGPPTPPPKSTCMKDQPVRRERASGGNLGALQPSIPSRRQLRRESRPSTTPHADKSSSPRGKHHQLETIRRDNRGLVEKPYGTKQEMNPYHQPLKREKATDVEASPQKHLQKSSPKAFNKDKVQPMPPDTGNNGEPSTPPELPYTWRYAVAGTSSFERALDEVAHKLDAMEDQPAEPAQPVPSVVEPTKPSRKGQRVLDLQKTSATSNQPGTSSAAPLLAVREEVSSLSLDAGEQSIDYHDRDISDRDVLFGLKMAVSAACDEDFDAWIRCKTGLRLRRFLCDLKAFEGLERELTKEKKGAKAVQKLQPGQRLEAERERRRREAMKEKPTNLVPEEELRPGQRVF